MSNHHYATGTGDNALCLGKRTWWKPLLEGRKYQSVGELAVAINARLTEDGRIASGEWSLDEVQQMAEGIWSLGSPFRVWSDDDCRVDLDKDYTIIAGLFQDAAVGASLGDHLFGYYPDHGIVPRGKHRRYG